MSNGLLQKLVEEDYGYENSSGVWGRSKNHDSLVVNEENQTWFWNSRGVRGDVIDYLVIIRGMTNSRAKQYARAIITGDMAENENKVYPYEKLIDTMWNNGKNKRDYWYSRHLNDDTIDRRRLGFYEGWYLIPIYERGNFLNFQMRRDEPEKRITKWYKQGNPTLYNDGILPFTKRIYIVEGTVDAILLYQEGFPAVSQMGTHTWQVKWFDKFVNIPEIYYIEDNDKAGRFASKAVANCLGLDRVKVVTWEGKPEKYDTVDFFREGNTAEDFKNYIQMNSKYLYEMEKIHVQKRKSYRISRESY